MLAPGMRSGVARPLVTQRIATDDSIERLRDAMRNLSRRVMHGVMHGDHGVRCELRESLEERADRVLRSEQRGRMEDRR